MTWTPIAREDMDLGCDLVERIREARAAPGEAPDWLPADALVEAYGDKAPFVEMVLTWIRTASAAGYGYGQPNWLPSRSDFSKSALLERLRSGKAPLDEPPPLGMSCPWYALVEDPGPHYVMEAALQRGHDGVERWVALQNAYDLVEVRGERDFVVRDARHRTAYRFRLWHDPEYRPPGGGNWGESWFLRNVAFEAGEVPTS